MREPIFDGLYFVRKHCDDSPIVDTFRFAEFADIFDVRDLIFPDEAKPTGSGMGSELPDREKRNTFDKRNHPCFLG